MAEDLGRALGWDEPIDNVPDDDFELFDPGYYPFEVTKIERASFNGSAKMAASPMAKLTLKLTNPADGRNSYVFYNIILNAKMIRRIKELFISIGLTPEGIEDDKLVPRWDAVVGATGWLQMAHREYNGNIYADVKKCLKPSEVARKGLGTTAQQPTYAAPAAAAAPQTVASTPQRVQSQTYVQQQIPMSTVPAQQPMGVSVPAGVPIQQVAQQVPQTQPAPAAPAPGVF